MAPEPSSERVGLVVFAITAAVLVVAGIVLALAFSRDGGGGETKPGVGVLPTAPASVPTTATTAPRTTRTTAPGVWPVGLTAWTVVLATLAQADHPRAAAERVARSVEVLGLETHVLDSSQHPRLRPKLWIVFAGRFSTRARALAAAKRLQAAGASRTIVERLTG